MIKTYIILFFFGDEIRSPFVLNFFEKKKNLSKKNHFFIFVVFVLDFLKIHFVKKKSFLASKRKVISKKVAFPKSIFFF